MLGLLASGFCVAAVSTSALADNPVTVVNVNANVNRRAISPLIYGANWMEQAAIGDLNLSVNRRGGNATTTYNWQQNAANRAGDWYFESLGDGQGDLSLPSVGADEFTNTSLAGGAEPMMTIPMVDWVAKLGPNRERLAAYSVAKYGAQTASDPWWPDAGNGIKASDGTRVANDPNDAYTPNSPAFQKLWVEHLVNKFGTSANGGIKFYLTDNEHGVWPSNHRPIVPVGPTMDSIRDRIIAYAGMVKDVDPNAQIVGPEEWGWTNYFNSPFDTDGGNGADRAAHGGWDYQPWLLKELKAHEDGTGRRLLDVFSLHYYPQYSEFGQGDSSPAAQLKRNESTRDLWDPNYVSSSWIHSSVKLIPRMKEWVNTHYPNTKLAITEYSWGAEGHISGAIAQADVLGIFGREGVHLATFWGGLNPTAPIYNAFKMYRNYDGNKSTFGDTSVSATVANPDNVAAFAAQRGGDGALTVMVVCKYLTENTPVTVNLAGFAAGGSAQVWQLTSANTINRLADTTVSGNSVSLSAPSQSITLLVIPGTNLPPTSLRARYSFEGNVQDVSSNGFHGMGTGLTYVTGKAGVQAAQFNGSGASVTIPPSVTDDFTVTMWVKTTDSGGWAGANWWTGKGLVDGEIGGGGADWGTSIVNGKFVLGIGSTGGDTTIASSVNINDGTWRHLAATRNTTTGAMQVYVDGVLRGSGTGPTGSRSWPSILRIGGLQPGSNYLNGALDDVRLYDRVLTASEVAESFGPPPGVPAGLSATAQSNGSITLDWSASASATDYRVKRSTTSGSGYSIIAAPTGTQFTDTNVSYGTTYYYIVTALNVSDESLASAQVTATPQLTPPPIPTGLAGTVVSPGQIDLVWTASTTATGYRIKRATTSGGPYTTIATPATTSYSDIGAGAGLLYYYVVSATNAAGESADSTAIAARSDSLVLHLKLDETGGTVASDSSGHALQATLLNGPAFAPGRLDNALAFSKASSHHATLPVGVVSTLTDFTISAWVKPTSLDTWARVFDFGSGTGTFMYLTTRNSPNGRPVFSIKVGGGSEQQVVAGSALSTGVWTHVAVRLSGSTGTLYLNGVASGTNNAITLEPSGMGATTLNYLGRSQASGDPYFNGALDDFRIYSRALSAADVAVLAAGQLAVPQNPTATAGNAQIALAWSTVPGATGYTVRRSANSGGPYADLATGVAATSYTDVGLTSGVTWHYTIVATGLPGSGIASSPVSATTYTGGEIWRLANFGTVANTGNAADNADPDGDGWNNGQEYISGTDPNSRTSLLKIDPMQASGDDMNLSFPSVLGRTYRVERSATLLEGSWITVQDNIPGTGGTLQVTDLGGSGHERRFYRIVVGW